MTKLLKLKETIKKPINVAILNKITAYFYDYINIVELKNIDMY